MVDFSNGFLLQFRAPSTTLTALLQLVAVRLDAQRALISFVDKDHQVHITQEGYLTSTSNQH